MIPVLICPAYNRFDILERMLRSINHRVGRALVVDNARTGYQLPSLLNSGMFDRIKVWSPPFTSLGYAGTINFGILQTPDAPWWMWTNHDVVYGEHDLEQIAEQMDAAVGPKMLGGYCWGAINRDWVKIAGLLDEEFYPIYFDDTEYSRHVRSLGLEITPFGGTVVHGFGEAKGSLTIQSDERLRSANHSTFRGNEQRYIAKWGGTPGHETFERRWNGKPAPPPDIDHRAMAHRLWSGDGA